MFTGEKLDPSGKMCALVYDGSGDSACSNFSLFFAVHIQNN
jgi:hypothetical protein